MANDNALARVEDAEIVDTHSEYRGLTMVVSPTEALRRVQELQAFVAKVMVHNVDFGVIPGTDKPTLFQPGAQKLSELYGFAWRFEDDNSVQNWDAPLFVFRKRCVLTSRRDNRYVGDGIGSCNSREDRYAWRWIWDPPRGVPKEQITTRTTRNGKTQYRVPNPDIFSLVNTIEKMACKRAFVHAVIGATRSSGVFNQDMEDLPDEVFGAPDATRSWDSEPKPAPQPLAPDQVIAHGKTLATEEDRRAYWVSIKEQRKAWPKADVDRVLAALRGDPKAEKKQPAPPPGQKPSAESDAPPDDDRGDDPERY